MLITPKDYLEASRERLDEANLAYGHGRFGQAIWIAGVAIECCLRAYRTRRDSEFDARHDLDVLSKQSGFRDVVARDLARRKIGEAELRARLDRLRAAIHDAARIWHNNYRYASADRIRAQRRAAQLHRGIKGDILKANALVLVGSASLIVEEGRRLWTRSSAK